MFMYGTSPLETIDREITLAPDAHLERQQLSRACFARMVDAHFEWEELKRKEEAEAAEAARRRKLEEERKREEAWEKSKTRCGSPRTSKDCESLQEFLNQFPTDAHAAEGGALIEATKPQLQELAKREAEAAKRASEAAAEAERRAEQHDRDCCRRCGGFVSSSGDQCLGMYTGSQEACFYNCR
jgi:hypothetical protein